MIVFSIDMHTVIVGCKVQNRIKNGDNCLRFLSEIIFKFK